MDVVSILFVADSDDVLVATYRLQRMGFDVDARTVVNARELEEAMVGWRPDVIVCDVRLPDSRAVLIVADEHDYPNVLRNPPQGMWAVVHKGVADELVATISRSIAGDHF